METFNFLVSEISDGKNCQWKKAFSDYFLHLMTFLMEKKKLFQTWKNR